MVRFLEFVVQLIIFGIVAGAVRFTLDATLGSPPSDIVGAIYGILSMGVGYWAAKRFENREIAE